jgi:hypothetical protein
MFSAQNFQENTFLKTKSNFPLTGKCFPLTNFSTDKQTQKNLKNNFSKITFQKTNITLINKQKSSECVFYLDSNSNFSFSVSHFAFYCRFNLSSFALFFFCVCGFSSTASPPSLYLRSRFSIHLLISFCNQISGRENKHKVVETMMMASESLNKNIRDWRVNVRVIAIVI